jgi:hypothetical protein
MPSKMDEFAQIAYLDVTVPAAGTLTFKLLQIATPSIQAPKLGLIISRVEFDVYAWMAACLAHAGAATMDACSFGLSVSNLVTSISQDRPEIIYAANKVCYFGTNVGVNFTMESIVRADFSTFPGGGILIPADRLYLCGSSDNVAAAANKITARMWYTAVELDAQKYLDLIEQRTIMST